MSDNLVNRRVHARINVGPDHLAQFQACGRSFDSFRLMNISLGGCCLEIPAWQADLLEKDTPLTKLVLMHPDLPAVQMRGRVTWVLGKHGIDPEVGLLMGIEFLDPSPVFLDVLQQHLQDLVEGE